MRVIFQIYKSVENQEVTDTFPSPGRLLSHFSFSPFVELMRITETQKHLLRCHILIDLKIKKFTAGDAGQMNFYLNYYHENIMVEGDNPPVGLILCTDRDETRVKYATAGLDNALFVSKYLTQLPSEDLIREFLTGDRERTIL